MISMHYVCGDIHGQYDDYIQILEQIDLKDDDTLYIIGDAIDRGSRPVDVLIDIMSRKNVVFTIGNHEHMMIQSLLHEDSNQLYSWTLNGAETTYKQWDELDTDKQTEILNWLNECPIVIPDLYVNGRNYYLTHACHLPYVERKRVRYCDVPVSKIEKMIWARTYQYPDPKKLAKQYGNLYQAYPNTTLIVGHNPVYRCSYGILKKDGTCRISRACSGHLINIDCGCAKRKPLGCIRLEDGKEFYAKHKESVDL